MQPIYTSKNTTPAFQLNWSVSLFGKADFPPLEDCLGRLAANAAPDGVRILESRLERPNVGQFFVSTKPEVTPAEIVRSLKGRWQHLIRTQHASIFRRNYYIGSVGAANCQVLDQYVAGQTDKHAMADPQVQERLQSLQFYDDTIHLDQARTSNHGRFIYNLQVVVENADNLFETRECALLESQRMIVRAAASKRWRLSRIGLLCNHLHIVLGAAMTESPASVALALMNNLAHVQGMKPVFRYSYFVGTFGPYDRNAIWRQL